MPRVGNTYSKPSGTTAVSGNRIESATFNTLVDDLVNEQNQIRPVTAGGTGRATVAELKADMSFGDMADETAADYVTAVAAAATDAQNVKLTGAQTIAGAKTLSDRVVVAASLAEQLRLGFNTGAPVDGVFLTLYDGETTRKGYIQAIGDRLVLVNEAGATNTIVDIREDGEVLINGIRAVTYAELAPTSLTSFLGTKTHSVSYQNASGRVKLYRITAWRSGVGWLQTSPDGTTWTDVHAYSNPQTTSTVYLSPGHFIRINSVVTVTGWLEGVV